MGKSIKLTNNDYWDQSSVLCGNISLENMLANMNNDIINLVRKTATVMTSGNANDLTSTGVYYITNSASNTPFGSWVYVITFSAHSGDHLQLSFCITNPGLWYRSSNSGNWSDWTKLADHYDTGWVAITSFGSYFKNYGGSFATAACRREHKRVQLRGLLNVTTERNNAQDVVCTLPSGYRPGAIVYTLATSSSGEYSNGAHTTPITIQTDGRVVLHNGYCKGWISLDGIFFYVN